MSKVIKSYVEGLFNNPSCTNVKNNTLKIIINNIFCANGDLIILEDSLTTNYVSKVSTYILYIGSLILCYKN